MKKKFNSIVVSMVMATVMLLSLFTPLVNAAPETETGNLHIFKYAMDDVSQAGPSTGGLEAENGQIPSDATPLPGVIFEVWKMLPSGGQSWGENNIPFPKNGWEALDAAKYGEIELIPLHNPASGDNRFVTDQQGQIHIDDLNGYYLVREAPGNAGIKAISEPFVVSVPMVDPRDNSSWLSDVYVYPKNEVSTVTKTVDGENIAHGDGEHQWKITTDIPNTIAKAAENAQNNNSYYYILDQLDPNFVFESGSVKVTGDKSSELTQGHHYNVAEPDSSNENTLRVEITKEGMDKLAYGDGSEQDRILSIEYNTTMRDDYDNNISIHNNAQVFYAYEGDPDNPDPPTEPIEKPFIFDGMVGLTKYAADQQRLPVAVRRANYMPLAGAAFKIAATEDDAKNGNFIWDTEEVSDNWGMVQFRNLPMTPLFDADGTFREFAEQSFWVVEVKAPQGYNLLDGPVEVRIINEAFENQKDMNGDPIPNTVKLKDGYQFANVELDVYNTPGNTLLELPKTGGTGTIMFTIAGIVLIGVAVTLLVAYRKKAK